MAHDRPADFVLHVAAGADRLQRILRKRVWFASHCTDQIRERALHVFHLPQFVIRPFPMEPHHRQTPFVFHGRIQITVRILVWNHLAAAPQNRAGSRNNGERLP